jgi:hypothetical protein
LKIGESRPRKLAIGEDSGGFGEDIAILDTGYFLSQIILSLVMGKLVELTGAPHLYFLAASACGFMAAAMAETTVTFGSAVKEMQPAESKEKVVQRL